MDNLKNNIDQDNKETNICAPIRNIAEIWNTLQTPPSWTNSIIDLNHRSPTVIDNKTFKCHSDDYSSCQLPTRLDRQLVPRTLVCHDMKNGYLEDKYVGTVSHGNGYTFYRWSQIDIFVYFSHHFITIPPLAWINVAHKNGVKILGTFITEWDQGKAICNEFLKDLETMRSFVQGLVNLTALYKLDGWLLNIENPIEHPTMLLEFVRYLTEVSHSRIPGSVIIWYDSVTQDGTLKWQNELNEKNRCYFDVCDGIFVNYTWTETNVATSAKFAQHRIADVYYGVDVFGRNTYGGGQNNCHVAADKIRSANMSMAIFAQGWTYETLEQSPKETFFERFLERDNALWRSLWKYLYTHPITTFFDTFFYTGADQVQYNLHDQEQQLSRFLHSSKPPIHEKECNCLQLFMDGNTTSCHLSKNSDVALHHLFACDMPVHGDVILYTFTKQTAGEKNDSFNIVVIVQENGTFRKIVCSSMRRQQWNNTFSLVTLNPCPDNRVLQIDADDKVPKDATLRCYHLKFSNPSRILDISGHVRDAKSIILCGIGIKGIRQ